MSFTHTITALLPNQGQHSMLAYFSGFAQLPHRAIQLLGSLLHSQIISQRTFLIPTVICLVHLSLSCTSLVLHTRIKQQSEVLIPRFLQIHNPIQVQQFQFNALLIHVKSEGLENDKQGSSLLNHKQFFTKISESLAFTRYPLPFLLLRLAGIFLSLVPANMCPEPSLYFLSHIRLSDPIVVKISYLYLTLIQVMDFLDFSFLYICRGNLFECMDPEVEIVPLRFPRV